VRLFAIIFASFLTCGFGLGLAWADGTNTAGAGPVGYQLNAMDKVSVTVAQDPVAGKPAEVSVSPLGDLTVPVSRCCEDAITVNVRGKSVEDVEKEIREKLEKEFYEKATVQLRVIDATRRRGQVLLTGAVRSNSVQLDPGRPKTLWEALTEAGVSDFANLKKVKVDRVGKGVTIYDVDAVKKGDRSKDVELQDGDRITVPEKAFNF
jgi:protein involved in polysaccharide export with SLBB domain